MTLHRHVLAILALTGVITAAATTRAEVRHADAAGFDVGGSVIVDAPPATVWARLVTPDAWWSAEHRWFEGGRLTLELRPGGCWCESGPDGAGARHMIVGYLEPGRALTLLGGLGPLQSMGLDGALQLTLAPEGEATRLVWTYVVSGYQPDGIAFLAAPVDAVLTEQVGRLKAAAET